ncbi:hypothetical protein [Paracoccus ravus]|uniref:hypothetical protein n=1 Tax=Paracoccus ravus TaxID=2447760 RepID=UPI001FD6F0A9|nr:hypothetical protein [Paracoccus ravus]
MRKTAAILTLLIVLLLAGAAVLCLGLAGQAAAPQYLAAAVTRGDIEETVMAEGQLKPEHLVAVARRSRGGSPRCRSRTRVTAPSDGTVLAIVNQAGQTVNAVQFSPTIVVLGQLDRMSVHATIS